ncbi:MAG: glutamine--tRNA ligase/YqeY domain fusion protein [Gammaproteobacteria bacterium]
MTDQTPETTDFIRQIIAKDIADEKHGGDVVTRFPPEPNGYLHVGHAKSICLNFGVAQEVGGSTFLRFDDTNPSKESEEYVAAIKRDVEWLGFEWGDQLSHASDYFDQLYAAAESLIKRGLAYVDSLSAEEIREYRGTLTEPGKNSPHRDRSVDENLSMFRAMKAGEYDDGAHVLRAKIDMSSPNMNLRDPALYRIRRVHHQRTGDAWCIYPMYDFAHALSDGFEGITHSLCTLEFEDHRPLYDWLLDQVETPTRPQQIEFSRLNLAYTITSKRKLNQLVEQGSVSGWDDPRMPTIAGMRRRGYAPEALREFCRRIGITKKYNLIEMGALESVVRDTFNESAPRVMAVTQPLKVTLTNYPEDKTEMMPAANHPNNESMGSREMPFGRTLYIERDDFMEEAPRKFFRLKPGGAVRLRYGYIIDCVDMIKDDEGHVVELLCTYDEDTRSGTGTSDRKVKGTIHWVSAESALPVTINMYDRLFTEASPGGDDWLDSINPDSLTVMHGMVEPSIAGAEIGKAYQFERTGYFAADTTSSAEQLVFNRVVTLRDSWAKLEKQALQKANS